MRAALNYRGALLIWTHDLESGITSDLYVEPNEEFDWGDFGYHQEKSIEFGWHRKLYWDL